MTDAGLAWAAGLFEGEGCSWTSRNKNGTVKIGLSVTSTDRDVLERFAAIVGGTGRVRARAKNPTRNAATKPVFQWTTQEREDVRRILRLMRPLLGERRAAKADVLLSIDFTRR